MTTINLYSKEQIDAKIPVTTIASAGDVLTLDSNKDAIWQAPSGGSDEPDIIVDNADISISSVTLTAHSVTNVIIKIVNNNYIMNDCITGLAAGGYDKVKVRGNFVSGNLVTGDASGWYERYLTTTDSTIINKVKEKITVKPNFTGHIEIRVCMNGANCINAGRVADTISINNGVITMPSSLLINGYCDTRSGNTSTSTLRVYVDKAYGPRI